MSNQKIVKKNDPEQYHFWCRQMLSYCLMINDFDDCWSNEFFRKDVKEMAVKFQDNITKSIDFSTLTIETARKMGVHKWMGDDILDGKIERFKEEHPEGTTREAGLIKLENMRNLYLLPPPLFKALPKDTKLYSIFGEERIAKDIKDMEVRGGCLAYGLHPDQFYQPNELQN